jgi:hypothetical protein
MKPSITPTGEIELKKGGPGSGRYPAGSSEDDSTSRHLVETIGENDLGEDDDSRIMGEYVNFDEDDMGALREGDVVRLSRHYGGGVFEIKERSHSSDFVTATNLRTGDTISFHASDIDAINSDEAMAGKFRDFVPES